MTEQALLALIRSAVPPVPDQKLAATTPSAAFLTACTEVVLASIELWGFKAYPVTLAGVIPGKIA